MTKEQFISAVDAYFEAKMRKCEISDEEKYRVYEMFLDWYKDNTDIPEVIEDYDIKSLRQSLWEDFCDVHDVNPKSAHFGDGYPYGLDPDEKEDYDEMIGDMMTKD